MCSRFHKAALAVVGVLFFSACGDAGKLPHSSLASPRVLRVCSDPNNLPFSNQLGEGFENRIAELISRDMDARLEYTWFAQRRGFVRNTLNAGSCDVLLGVPHQLDAVDTTRPYYRSTYVFVTRERDQRIPASLDDELLKALRIGVHVAGDDYSNPPPLHALGRRNIINNVSGYSIFGDYSKSNPPARLVEAVADGTIDVAIIWGPFGGYFGLRQPVAMRVAPVSPETDGPSLPFVFEISMAVRKGDHARLQELQGILERRQSDIDRILQNYGVPLKFMGASR